VSGRDGRRGRRAAGATVVVLLLVAGAAAIAQPSTQRLLVFDVPFQRVWERAVREMQAYPLARAEDGVIETARTERAPLPGEEGVDRVAERITIRVEAVAEKVTRVTATVEAEALRNGRWQPLGGSPAAVRAVLDRIRAAIG
jgi:hypothetical protein